MPLRLATVYALAAALALPAAAAGHDLRRHEQRSLASLPALPAAPAQADEPDLRISLPSVPYAQQVAPVYLDAHEEPGRLLYRFDALIHNTGGTLDLYGNAGEVTQAVWPGGDPATAPRPDSRPPAGEAAESDRHAHGARFAYVFEATHDHWHFFSAARYSLLVPGADDRVSEKVGFCMFDSFGTPGGETWWFPSATAGGSWCGGSDPGSTFVRMGLSRGATDRYSAQHEFQYVDVTGLAPGEYVLRAEADPHGHLAEHDRTDNVHVETRALPGVRARGASAAVDAGRAVAVPLAAEALAPEVPARASGSCTPRATSRSCYDWADDAPPRFAVAEPPAHGTVTVDDGAATYTPAPGYAGGDRFTYTATDARGLVSEPAAVEIRVAPASGTPPPPAGAGEQAAPRRLLRIERVRRAGRRAVAVRLRCRPAAVGACAGRVEARAGGRRAGRRRFGGLRPAAARTVRLRLARPLPRSARLVLRATVRDAAGAGTTARRAVRVP